MSRRRVALAILAVWVAALIWLVHRTYWQPRAERLERAVRTLPPGATYYAVFLGGRQVGYASSTVDTLPDTLRVVQLTTLEVPVRGGLRRSNARTDALLSRTLQLRGFTAAVRGETARYDAIGTVDGDSAIELSLVGADDSEQVRVPLAPSIVLPGILPLDLTFRQRIAAGDTYTRTVFDPTLLHARAVTLTAVAESTFIVPDSAVFDSTAKEWVPATYDTLRTWRMHETGGRHRTLWIDRSGQIVRVVAPSGYTVERTAFEIAYDNYRRHADSLPDTATVPPTPGAVMRETALAAGVPLRPDTLRVLTLAFEGGGLDTAALAGPQQELSGDTLTVRRANVGQLNGRYRLPSHDAALAPYLEGTPAIQRGDPRIGAQARQIVGRTRNPRRAAELLAAWVHDHVAADTSTGLPTALGALAHGRGDCDAHTLLYVALARAVGLPARTAAGLVYLDGAFYYHAWAEVYLDGWVPVDPTLGEFPADAGHVRFAEGALARQPELLPLIGRFTITVVNRQD